MITQLVEGIIDGMCYAAMLFILFALLGCGGDPDAKPRPIKSSKTCCQSK